MTERAYFHISTCCNAPMKYREGKKKEMIAFCCRCDRPCDSIKMKLSDQMRKRNKQILLRSIFGKNFPIAV